MIKQTISSQKGFGQWIIVVVLLIGISVGVWVAQIRTNYFPQASAPKEYDSVTPALLKLTRADEKAIEQGSTFLVDIRVKNDLDSTRLISARLNFNPEDLEVERIIATKEAELVTATSSATPSAKIAQWVETLFDNKTGSIAITGLAENEGFKTKPEDPPALFAQVLFKVKSAKETSIALEDSSLMLRTQDNANLLVKKENLTIMPSEATAEQKGVK